MPFRAQLEECYVLNPYLKLNSSDTFRAQLKEHQQSHLWSTTKSLVDHASEKPTPNAAAVKSPSGGHVPLGAKRLKTINHSNHRLAGQPTPSGANTPIDLKSYKYRLARHPSLPGASHLIKLPRVELSPDGLNTTARRHTSTCDVLV